MLVPLREDYFIEFKGFHNVPSRAHIRVVHDEGKPLVIVCSQPLYGAGTSVQNAYEIIKNQLFPVINARVGIHGNEAKARELDSIRHLIKENKSIKIGFTVWLLNKLSSYLRRDTYHRYQIQPNLNAVWLEHWPPGTDSIMGPPDDYLLIRENIRGTPSWVRVDVESFTVELGYKQEDVMKPLSVLENDPRKPRKEIA